MKLTPDASTSGSSLRSGGKSKKKSLGEGQRQEAVWRPEAWAVSWACTLRVAALRRVSRRKRFTYGACVWGFCYFFWIRKVILEDFPSNKSWDLSFSIWKNKLAFLNPPSLSWKSSYPQNYKPLSCQKWALYAQHTFVVHSFFCARDFLWLLFLWLCLCMMQVRCKTGRWMRRL